jgi:hypothetical protein
MCHVIAGEAKQSSSLGRLDRFVASLLAMTGGLAYFTFVQSLPGHSTYVILPSGVFFQIYIT